MGFLTFLAIVLILAVVVIAIACGLIVELFWPIVAILVVVGLWKIIIKENGKSRRSSNKVEEN